MTAEYLSISTPAQQHEKAREILLRAVLHGPASVPLADRQAVAEWILTSRLDRRSPGPGNLDIRSRRRELGLTQAQLAQLLGVDRTTVIRWERTRRVPSIQLSRRLAEVLGLNYRDVSHLGRAHRSGGTSRSRTWLARAAERYRPDWPLIGDNLRAARELAGVTQAELARRVGVSRSTLSLYERGLWQPTAWSAFQDRARAALGL